MLRQLTQHTLHTTAIVEYSSGTAPVLDGSEDPPAQMIVGRPSPNRMRHKIRRVHKVVILISKRSRAKFGGSITGGRFGALPIKLEFIWRQFLDYNQPALVNFRIGQIHCLVE